ncbi:MAG: PEGA domain-containing protein [Spirochaetales bacterium]|nr:PEGA domain-containing protein [Spirochaetales bacterium]
MRTHPLPLLLLIVFASLCGVPLASQVQNAPSQTDPYSVQVGLGVFFDSSMFTHPEIIRKIEGAAGIVLLDTDVMYRKAYAIPLSNAFLLAPGSMRVLPTSRGRERYVRIMEYILSLVPGSLLDQGELGFLKADIAVVAREVPSFPFMLGIDSRLVLKPVYEDGLFSGYLVPDSRLLPQEFVYRPGIAPGALTPGSTVYLISRAAQQSQIRHVPGEVLRVTESGFFVKIDAGREFEGTVITDIRGNVYGIAALVDPAEKTVEAVFLDPVRDSIQKAGVSLAMVEPQGEVTADEDVQEPSSNIYEVGQTFFIITADRMKVYLDNTYYGETPLLLKNIQMGEYPLRIESADARFEGVLRVIPSRKDVITIKPPVAPRAKAGEPAP